MSSDVVSFFQNSEVRKLCISDAGNQALIEFIADSFTRNQSGEVVQLKNGVYGDSKFYDGVGDYYLLNTCNKWMAKGLKSAGLGILPVFKLAAVSVMDYVQRHNTCPDTALKRDVNLPPN